MAEVLGSLASGIQVADSILRLAKALRHFIDTVRFTPQEVQRFHSDLTIFARNLQGFCEITNKRFQEINDIDETERRAEKQVHVENIIRQCEEVEMGFNQLLNKFFEYPERLPSAYSYIDRIKWYFRKPQVAELRLSLESAKSSVQLFINLDAYKVLLMKVLELERDRQEVPKELERQLQRARDQLKEQTAVTKRAEKQLQKYIIQARRPITPLVADISSIIQTTHSVKKYATKTLKETSSSVQSSAASRQKIRRSRRSSPRPSRSGYLHLRTETALHPDTAYPNVSRSRKIYLRTTSDESDTPNFTNEQQISRDVDLGSEKLSGSPQPSVIADPEIFGPIIHDNDNEMGETYGGWRRESSQLSAHSGDRAPGVADRSTRLRHSMGKDETNKTTKPIRGEGSSPYKAMPPFFDEDWKGVRKQSSR